MDKLHTIKSIITFSQIRWYQIENLITVNKGGPFLGS